MTSPWQSLGGGDGYALRSLDPLGNSIGLIALDENLAAAWTVEYDPDISQVVLLFRLVAPGDVAPQVASAPAGDWDPTQPETAAVQFMHREALRDGDDYLVLIGYTPAFSLWETRLIRLRLVDGALVYVGAEPSVSWVYAPGYQQWDSTPFGPDRVVLAALYGDLVFVVLTHDGSGGLTLDGPQELSSEDYLPTPGYHPGSYGYPDFRYFGWVGGDDLVANGYAQWWAAGADGLGGYVGFLACRYSGGTWTVTDSASFSNGIYGGQVVTFDLANPRAAFLAENQSFRVGGPFDPDYIDINAESGDVPSPGVITNWDWTWVDAGNLAYVTSGSGSGDAFAYVEPGWTDSYWSGNCAHWGADGGAAFRISPDLTSFMLLARDGLYWVDHGYRELLRAWTEPMEDGDYWQVEDYTLDGSMRIYHFHHEPDDILVVDPRNKQYGRRGFYDRAESADPTVFTGGYDVYLDVGGWSLVVTVADVAVDGTMTLTPRYELSPPHGQDTGRDARIAVDNLGRLHVFAMDYMTGWEDDLPLWHFQLDPTTGVVTGEEVATVSSNMYGGSNLVPVGPTGLLLRASYWSDVDSDIKVGAFDEGGAWLPLGGAIGLTEPSWTVDGYAETGSTSPPIVLDRDMTLLGATVEVDGDQAGPGDGVTIVHVKRGTEVVAYGAIPDGPPYQSNYACTVLVAELDEGDALTFTHPHVSDAPPSNLVISLHLEPR